MRKNELFLIGVIALLIIIEKSSDVGRHINQWILF